MQQVKYMCELIFADLIDQPLLIFFSIVKTLSDTECNIQKFKPYSPDHNTENSYELDRLIEYHPYKESCYFTVRNQTFRTVKNAISNYFKKFDTDTIAVKTRNKYMFSHSSQYYRKSVEEIKAMWAEKRDSSARLNRKMRDDVMKMLSNQICSQDETTTLFEMFNKEWKISPYRTNWPVFDRETGIVANVDCLAYMNGKFILFSWVRTDSAIEIPNSIYYCDSMSKYVVSEKWKSVYIKSYYDDGLKGMAFSNLSDCKFTKYSIEQEVIKHILKKDYGIIVDENYIVILHPAYGTPVAFRGDPVAGEVEQFMISEAVKNESRLTIASEYEETIRREETEVDTESVELMELF